MTTAEDLRARLAAVLLDRITNAPIVVQSSIAGAPGPGAVTEYDLADAALAVLGGEVEALRARVAAYENAITWGVSCTRHAELLDECRRQEERAERAEAALAAARENRGAESHAQPRTRPTPSHDTRDAS